MSGKQTKNPAVPIWFVIHNVAVWSGGLLWATDHGVWAALLGLFGLWALVWAIGLMRAPDGQQKGLRQ